MAKKSLKPEKRAKSPKSAQTAGRSKKTEVKRKAVAAAAAPKVQKSVKKQAAAARKPAAAKVATPTKAAKVAMPTKAAKVATPKKVVRSAAAAAPVQRKAAPAAAPAAVAKAAPAKMAAPRPQPPSVSPPPAQNGVETRMPVVKKPALKLEFKTGEHIVYPAHGVGRIVGVESQEVAGLKLDLFVISFIKDKMTLRVPVAKATAVGMRKLADGSTVKRALETVRGRARIKRTMWSRRAQEYEAKINSGDLISIAEVVRDLYRSETQPEQSYSERQLYEAALDRMSREISSVNRISETEAVRQIEQNLAKSPRRGPKPEAVEPREEAA
jgi:CarD family transcriptional regulator